MYQVPPYDLERRNGAGINGSNGTNGNHLTPAPTVLMPLPGPATQEGEGGLDFHAIWNAFRRRWFLALSLGLLFGIPAAIGVWFIAPAPYVAFAEVRMNSMAEGFPGANTRPVHDFDIRKQAVLRRATHPMLLNEALRPHEVRNASLIREQEPHVTTWLEENLSLKSVGMEYIRIELEGEHPTELALVVNSVADALVADVDHDMTEDLTNRKSQLDKLIAEVKTSLSSKNSDLENMRNALKIDPNEIERRQSYLIELTASLRSALVTIELEKLKLQGQKQSLPENAPARKAELNELVDKVALNDVRYQRAAEDMITHKKQIETQEKYIVNLTEGLSETHPKIVAAKAKLESLKTQLTGLETKEASVREEIRKEVMDSLPKDQAIDPEVWYENARKVFEAAFAEKEKELKTELETIKNEQKDLERYSFNGARITRDIEREQERLNGFEEDLQKLEYEIENTPTAIEKSRPAEAPHTRSLKKKTMFSGAAGFGLFGAFVAGIVFLEYRTQRIASITQVSEKLNLRVMGTVPLLPRSISNGNSAKKKAKNALWYSALTEAVDSTRTLLLRGSQIESLKTVMIASAVAGEGKTTMASHLATSLARGGRKILLIDCDLRRPCMHKAFDLPPGKGVCEILRGEADVADCIQELNSPVGLSVLPAGKINQQVLKLLALDTFGEMLEGLKNQYDFIIIDSSPLLPVTDGLLVAHHVDGVILSIRRDVSRISKVLMACQKLSMLGIPLLGAVTIGLQEESGYQSKYGYNYYAYGHRQHYYTQPPPV